MLRIAIAEDKLNDKEILLKYIEKFQNENDICLKTDIFSDAINLVEDYRPVYDLLLLDIEMPIMDGMTAAARIRGMDSRVIIIFITNMTQYAIKSYEVGALDYVLKPIRYFALSEKLKKVARFLAESTSRYLLLKTRECSVRVCVDDILYIEVVNHYIHVYTMKEEFSIAMSMKEMEYELEGDSFARCNKGYLVNIRQISCVKSNSVILTDGTELQLSRLRKKEFLLSITNYYGGRGMQ